jgi:tetratricopeptide (TPR) repeat protein
VLSDSEVAQTLQQMTRPTSTKLTPEVARELCLRAESKAYIAGSIASLGSQYVMELKAVNCAAGSVLAQEQVTAPAKEKVLDALGTAASKLRVELGESLATVQKFDVPLEEATTSSLDALKAYSLGEKALRESEPDAALPYHQRAIELDPRFARGYDRVGFDYWSLSQSGRGSEYFTKAFQLRDHASEREKLAIAGDYYYFVSGELEKAAQAYREEIQNYPREYRPYIDLGNTYGRQGEYEKAREAYSEGLRLDPHSLASYIDLANDHFRGNTYLATGQGSAAAAEFQKILDHSGIVWNCWTGALAHLGVARANALEARTSQGADADAARTRALAAYKDFLTLWKDADPDIPILKEAKVEYARLQ